MLNIVNTLHELALKYGCSFETETGEDGISVTEYSLRDLEVTEDGGDVMAEIKTPFIGLKRLFDETGDPGVREILFKNARKCSHCISDKCTALLMAPARTLDLGGKSKKACSMWGQRVKMFIDGGNFNACVEIIERFLSDAVKAGEKHEDVRKNDVAYTLSQKGEFFIAGYCHKHTPISAKDEDAVKSLLPLMPGLCKALDISDEGKYIGATANFVNGSQYDFIFGVICDKKPDASKLPESVTFRKMPAGEWAVYNSSLSKYPSIWRHYTDKFYDKEKRGWDAYRFPFEIYDKSGNWRDVHIPVDADAPKDAGSLVLWEHRPDFGAAGWERVGEEDHPDWFDNGDIEKRLTELLKTPGTARFCYSLHQYYGKPMRFSNFIVTDDTLDIPEDFMRRTIKGGLWRINGDRHFNGGAEHWDMDEPHKLPFEKQHLSLDHPRVFGTYSYDARGGYDETWIPFRAEGEFKFETVELPPLRLFAKLEDPLNGKTVPDEELRTYYSLPGNAEPGTLAVGYKAEFFKHVMLYAEPLKKGVIAGESAVCPDGFNEYMLEGGKFVKITETNPDGSPYLRGEPGWEAEFVDFPRKNAPDISESTDFSRHCRMLQTGNGKYYELYVPVKKSVKGFIKAQVNKL
ncbi:MAG: GyrI-like domain-containing protein [Oscillospiraceae bacterium]|nr:GyrI-like domain-containing protein [Oscillospiraceae bacterium]